VAGLERALPASYYLSPESFARERELVLYREWFCAGRADQVERPGSHPELCRVVPAFKRGGAGLDWERGIPHREGAWTFTAGGP
jgi:hypothetical protein